MNEGIMSTTAEQLAEINAASCSAVVLIIPSFIKPRIF